MQWGCRELERLQLLHDRPRAQVRLSNIALSREATEACGLADLITGGSQAQVVAPTSPGTAVGSAEVVDSYMENEGKALSPGYFSRAKRLKGYFGAMSLASVTKAVIQGYVDARLRGELGMGRSRQAAYVTTSRKYQRNQRRRDRGSPIAPKPPVLEVPHTGSVRHELELLRQALKAFAGRSDKRRRQG